MFQRLKKLAPSSADNNKVVVKAPFTSAEGEAVFPNLLDADFVPYQMPVFETHEQLKKYRRERGATMTAVERELVWRAEDELLMTNTERRKRDKDEREFNLTMAIFRGEVREEEVRDQDEDTDDEEDWEEEEVEDEVRERAESEEGERQEDRRAIRATGVKRRREEDPEEREDDGTEDPDQEQGGEY